MQTGFIGFIVKPIFSAWCDFVPALKELTMPHIEANVAIWKAETPFLPPAQQFVTEGRTDWDWDACKWK